MIRVITNGGTMGPHRYLAMIFGETAKGLEVGQHRDAFTYSTFKLTRIQKQRIDSLAQQATSPDRVSLRKPNTKIRTVMLLKNDHRRKPKGSLETLVSEERESAIG